ncbi:hypothetical protein [Rummeliibacillus pycnus]|uniref:hypothetical protein n=1 Tax=Rummeliibacillus pycnus TaxID=101070 RepID=UPI0037C5C9C2
MKRFLGLLKREWQLQYKWIFVACVFSIIVTVGIPYLVNKYIDASIDQNNVTFIMATILSIFTFLIVSVQFVKNLNRELRHADIWLHSTAPFYELIGAKLIFSLFSNLILVLLTTVVMVVAVSIEGKMTIVQDIKFMFVVNYLSTSMLVSALSLTLLLNTCYLYLKKWLGRFAMIVVMLLLFLISYGTHKITNYGLYSDFFLNGPKTNGWINRFMDPIIQVFHSDFFIEDLYLREDILSWLVTLIIMIFSIKWCEKVVKE